MLPLFVVVPSPECDFRSRIEQVGKPVIIQAFLAKSAIEIFDVSVFRRLGRMKCSFTPAACAQASRAFGPTAALHQPVQQPVAVARMLRSELAQILAQLGIFDLLALVAARRMRVAAQSRCTRGARSLRNPPVQNPLPGGVPRASPCFLRSPFQHLHVEREVGDDVLQSPILLLERHQLARVAHFQPAVLRSPAIEGVLADSELAH